MMAIVSGFLCLAGVSVVGCRDDESVKFREEAISEIAENMADAESERFLRGQLGYDRRQIATCRGRVESATSANELALAIEDLRMANDQQTRTLQQLRDLD